MWIACLEGTHAVATGRNFEVLLRTLVVRFTNLLYLRAEEWPFRGKAGSRMSRLGSRLLRVGIGFLLTRENSNCSLLL